MANAPSVLIGLLPLPADLQAHVAAVEAHFRAVMSHPEHGAALVAMGSMSITINSHMASLTIGAGLGQLKKEGKLAAAESGRLN